MALLFEHTAASRNMLGVHQTGQSTWQLHRTTFPVPSQTKLTVVHISHALKPFSKPLKRTHAFEAIQDAAAPHFETLLPEVVNQSLAAAASSIERMKQRPFDDMYSVDTKHSRLPD